MRTTLSISDDLIDAMRLKAAQKKRTFRAVLEDVIRLGLGSAEKPTRKRAFKVEHYPLGLKEGFRGLSMNQLYDQIEADAIRGSR